MTVIEAIAKAGGITCVAAKPVEINVSNPTATIRP